jgi:hypothetical protein
LLWLGDSLGLVFLIFNKVKILRICYQPFNNTSYWSRQLLIVFNISNIIHISKAYKKLNTDEDDTLIAWYQMLNISMNITAKNIEYIS